MASMAFSRSSYVAACRNLRGLGGRAHCAGERFCADKLARVMRLEVSVEISATRNSSGGASFCVRKRKSAAISVRFLMFWFITFANLIIIFIFLNVAFVIIFDGPAGVSKLYAKRAA